MKYDKENFTYGVELEYADVYRFNDLPDGCEWNLKDITTVNSTGIANDPLGKLWEYAGEINTKPTRSVGSQVKLIARINKMLVPKPWINYRCNLHIHIGVPMLEKDLKKLKKLLLYIHRFEKEAFKIVEPIPKPIRIDFESKEAYDGASKRYRRRLVSHQHILNGKTVERILRSKTPKEFLDNHTITNKKGDRLWFITPRAGINLRQLFETKTVEFRHFPGTVNNDEMYSCILWCREFMDAALNSGITPFEIFKKHKKRLVFPKFRRYMHDIDLLWRLTNLGKNTRKEIEKNINIIVENNQLLDIDIMQEKSSKSESGYRQKNKGISKWF